MANKDPAWEVSFYDYNGGGYVTSHVVAPTRSTAIRKAEKEIRVHSPEFEGEPTVVHKFSRKDEENFTLETLWRFFREIYFKHWLPGIKGTELIRKAKRELGKGWSGVWIR